MFAILPVMDFPSYLYIFFFSYFQVSGLISMTIKTDTIRLF